MYTSTLSPTSFRLMAARGSGGMERIVGHDDDDDDAAKAVCVREEEG